MGHLFSAALNILSFPAIVLHLRDLREGWQKWSRFWWWNGLIGLAGWRMMRKWTAQLRRGDFPRRLAEARRALKLPRQRGASG
jgi:hypothetical protein